MVGTVCLLNPVQQIREATSPVIIPIGEARIEIPRGTPISVMRKALLDFAHNEDVKRPHSAENYLDGLDAAHAEATVEQALEADRK